MHYADVELLRVTVTTCTHTQPQAHMQASEACVRVHARHNVRNARHVYMPHTRYRAHMPAQTHVAPRTCMHAHMHADVRPHARMLSRLQARAARTHATRASHACAYMRRRVRTTTWQSNALPVDPNRDPCPSQNIALRQIYLGQLQPANDQCERGGQTQHPAIAHGTTLAKLSSVICTWAA
jgi:hypothetical protein